jgi:hypothetical protein
MGCEKFDQKDCPNETAQTADQQLNFDTLQRIAQDMYTPGEHKENNNVSPAPVSALSFDANHITVADNTSPDNPDQQQSNPLETAGEALKHLQESAQRIAPIAKGLVDELGTAIENQIATFAPVNTLDFVKNVNRSFDTLDADHDEFITKTDIEQARQDPRLRFELASTFKALDKHFDNIQTLNNDAFIFDDKGISRKDLAVLANAKLHGTNIEEAFRNAPNLDLSRETGSTILGVGLAAKLAFNGGSPGKALLFGAGTFLAAEAGIASLKYNYLTAPKAESIINDLH